MHTYTPEKSISDGPVTNQLSVLCILIETISRAHAKVRKSFNGFRFGTLVGRFPSDGAASMAVKELSVRDEDAEQCPQTTTFEETREPKRNRTEILLLTSLTNALPLGPAGSQYKMHEQVT